MKQYLETFLEGLESVLPSYIEVSQTEPINHKTSTEYIFKLKIQKMIQNVMEELENQLNVNILYCIKSSDG